MSITEATEKARFASGVLDLATDNLAMASSRLIIAQREWIAAQEALDKAFRDEPVNNEK